MLFRDFPEIEVLSTGKPLLISAVETLRAQWQANLGVQINLRQAETWQAFVERVNSKSPPAMYINGWSADYPDADSFLRFFEFTRRHNATFDQLVEGAGHVSDQVERTKMYQAADRIVIDEAAVIPLWYWRFHLLVKPWVRHFRPAPLGGWHYKDIIIDPH